MVNLRLACLYSYDCRMAKEKGIQEILLDQINRKGNFSEKEVIAALQELQSYPAYHLIATIKSQSDLFNEAVIRAYWFGDTDLRFKVLRTLNHNFATLEKINIKRMFRINFGSEEAKSLLDCSISWGRVIKLNSDWVEVSETGLMYGAKRIILSTRKRKVDSSFLDKKKIKKDSILSIHISMAREIIDSQQASLLDKRTLEALEAIKFE